MPVEPGMIAAFSIGLLGSTHCVGMCGGIVGALLVSAGAAYWLLDVGGGGRKTGGQCDPRNGRLS